ncbi:MAG: TonB-dependent receptor [bacterium]
MNKLNRFLIPIIFLLFSYSLYSQTTSAISGTVKESGTREFITAATVILYNTDKTKALNGTYSNKYGFYSLPQVHPGNYILVIRCIGYKEWSDTITVKAGNDMTFNVFLPVQIVEGEEITVEGEYMTGSVHTISRAEITADFILKMPALGAESDVLRSLQMLPGVATSSELSSGIYVRGGTPDQNLYLLDGIMIYNPTHLGGFMSTFNTNALRDVNLIKGAFPAEYGGRLSSVLDMTMKEGSKEGFHGTAGISLIDVSATIEGPITEKSSFMFSARRLYLDLMMLALSKEMRESSLSYYFYDLNAKVNLEIDDKNHLFLSGMFGSDVLSAPASITDEFGINWGNTVGNIRWMHIVSPKLFTNFSLIYTKYKFNSDFSFDNNKSSFTATNGIQDLTFRGTIDYFPLEAHKIRAGAEVINHNFNVFTIDQMVYNNIPLDDPLWKEYNSGKKLKAMELGIYVQDEWQITELLQSNIGFRTNYYPSGQYFNIEPRVSLAYNFWDNMYLRAAVAQSHQPTHLITRNDMNLPTDVWIPSSDKILPGESWQYVLGFESELFKNYTFSVEGYYKTLKNIYEYKDTVSWFSTTRLVDQLTSGGGEGYGLEFSIFKKVGKLQGWIGYTWSVIKSQFDELNNGKWFYPKHDRRHDIKVVLSYDLNKKWEFSATWVYATGQPFTMPTSAYYFGSNNSYEPTQNDLFDFYGLKYQYSGRNEYRAAAYHRMDVNISRKTTMFGLPLVWSLNIYNVYNHMNPYTLYIGSEYNVDDNTSKYVLKQMTLFPIIPTLGVRLSF